MHATVGTLVVQVAVHVIGDERDDGSHQTANHGDGSVQSLVGGGFVFTRPGLPEAAAVAANIPVAEFVIDKPFDLEAEGRDVVVGEGVFGLANQFLQVGDDPAV